MGENVQTPLHVFRGSLPTRVEFGYDWRRMACSARTVLCCSKSGQDLAVLRQRRVLPARHEKDTKLMTENSLAVCQGQEQSRRPLLPSWPIGRRESTARDSRAGLSSLSPMTARPAIRYP